MSNAAKLKKKAAEFEQKKQFDKALQLYIQILDESAGEDDEADVALYNRVGDLLMRQGSTGDAESALREARGSGPTTLELLALEEEGLIELVREVVPASTDDDGIVVDVLGLTGNGHAFARDLPEPS